MKNYYTLFFLLLSFLSPVCAQPGQSFVGGEGNDHLAHVRVLPDGNLLAVGAKSVNGLSRVWLVKMTPGRDVIWEQTITPPGSGAHGYGYRTWVDANGAIFIVGRQCASFSGGAKSGIFMMADSMGDPIWKQSYTQTTALFDATPSGNGFLLTGWQDYTSNPNGGALIFVDASGALQWRTQVNVQSQTIVCRIFPTSDGNFLMLGRAGTGAVGFRGFFLRKITPDGTLIWQKTVSAYWESPDLSCGFDYQPFGAFQDAEGNIWLAHGANNGQDIGVFKYSTHGDLLWQRIYGSPGFWETPMDISPMSNGDILLAGVQTTVGFLSPSQGFMARIGPDGIEYWRQRYRQSNAARTLFAAQELADGSLFAVGVAAGADSNGNSDGWLLRTDPDGNAFPFKIEGRVVFDLNNNCQADPDEPPAKGWFVQTTHPGFPLLVTGADGTFSLPTEQVTNQFVLLPAAGNWTLCNPDLTLFVNEDNPTSYFTFLVQPADGGCADTEVGITQPDLLRCEESNFAVTVQNRGLGESGDLSLTLSLDPALSIVSASESYVASGHTVEFAIPPMNGLEQKNIQVKVLTACDVQLGATHGVVARLAPLECELPWAGARFAVEGMCDGAQAVFSLRNEGGGGANASTRYRVLADDLISIDWTAVALPEGGAPVALFFPADGRTWRVELEQTPGFPYASQPAFALEGCGLGDNGLHSIAMVNAWRFDEGAPHVAAFLAPNSTGVPYKIAEATRGFGSYKYIGDLEPMEFTARVRNPFDFPVGNVAFQLSFSSNFDISSFQPLASNGSYSLRLDEFGEMRVSIFGQPIEPGAYATFRFRISSAAGVFPDAGVSSRFIVLGKAFLDQTGPYDLSEGGHTFSHTFPNQNDPFNEYPPEILRYGGGYHDFGTTAALAPDGSVFLAGISSSYSDRTHNDVWIIKTDPQGRAIWLNAVDGGSLGHETVRGVAALPDGGCIAVGSHQAPANGSTLVGNFGFLMRLDDAGNVMWKQLFRPTAPHFECWVNGIVPAPDGNFVVFGFGEVENGRDHFYMKINEDGETIWLVNEDIIGSAFQPYKAIATPDGGFVLMGTNHSTVLNFNLYLEKIDGNGNVLWAAGHNTAHYEYMNCIALAEDGGIMVGGHAQGQFIPGQPGTTPMFLRFSSEGEFLWEKKVVISRYTDVLHMDAAPGGGFFAVGQVSVDTIVNDQALLLKIDENADIVWWRHYGAGNSEVIYHILSAPAGQLLLWGYNQARPPLHDLQGILVRTDMHGNPLVVKAEEPQSEPAQARVFPNPAQDVVHVSLPADASDALWELRDLSGRLLRRGRAPGALFSIGLENLPGGMYVLFFPDRHIAPVRIVATGR